jgi:SagB-type dehydrogenase family enzyme
LEQIERLSRICWFFTIYEIAAKGTYFFAATITQPPQHFSLYIQKDTRLIFSSLLRVLREDPRLTRRQTCQLAGMLGLSFSGLSGLRAGHASAKGSAILGKEDPMNLPAPTMGGHVNVEKAIKQRRTVRSFADEPLTVDQLSQLLWAAQGITDDGGLKRAAPSGGALYPIDVYAVVGKTGVRGLDYGVYHYDPPRHAIHRILDKDARERVAMAALGQMWMAAAPLTLVLTAEYRRITVKYGGRGERYAMIEVGHIGQNLFLQCEALGLGAGIVGAFDDKKVARVISAKKNHEPLIIMPIGWKG